MKKLVAKASWYEGMIPNREAEVVIDLHEGDTVYVEGLMDGPEYDLRVQRAGRVNIVENWNEIRDLCIRFERGSE